MSEPYVGEIRMFAGNYAPQGWVFCSGQLLSTSQYDALFNLIGTTYGGDGQSTFAVPDLRGRLPLHFGSGYFVGQSGGVETVPLTQAQIPTHNHLMMATTNVGNQQSPSGQVFSQSPQIQMYIEDTPDSSFATQMISPAGGSQPHNNVQPFLCINFIISLYGIYPSQT